MHRNFRLFSGCIDQSIREEHRAVIAHQLFERFLRIPQTMRKSLFNRLGIDLTIVINEGGVDRALGCSTWRPLSAVRERCELNGRRTRAEKLHRTHLRVGLYRDWRCEAL